MLYSVMIAKQLIDNEDVSQIQFVTVSIGAILYNLFLYSEIENEKVE